MLSENTLEIKTTIATKTIGLRVLLLKKYSLANKKSCWRMRACNFIYRRTIGQFLFTKLP